MEDRTKIIFGILFITIGIIILIFSFIYLSNGQEHIKERKVKCYDRNYNEILGQTCLEEYNERNGFMIGLAFLCASFLSLGTLFLISRRYELW